MSLVLLRNLTVLPRAQWRRNYSSNQQLQPVKMDYAVYQMPHSLLKEPPIVVMHGLNLSRAHWRRVARHLAKRGSRRVLAVDARNHGLSPHNPSHTPAHMVADVLAFMKQQQLGRIVALGHSMGGRTMMTLALQQPKRVERAIFVDITPVGIPKDLFLTPALFELMQRLAPTIPTELSLSEGRKFVLPHFSSLVKRDVDLQLIIMNLRKLPSGEFAWAVNPEAIIKGWSSTVSHYEKTVKGLKPYVGPVMLIAGKQSKFVTSSSLKKMKQYFPKTKVVYLDAGHRVHQDQPNKFVDLVVNFTRG
ncbi:protein ABHD11 [Scaptodrosophila lebanonensis]|uniref:sn-1-specific diacylglycerol lipase ABHD11 n=1 Tax=Drosophila lebanonensis TaxID=7225 RepID=A0A6J2TFC2_DROLE|nr:protein ABHD11 [Scaptodrosophila lebanonensis]